MLELLKFSLMMRAVVWTAVVVEEVARGNPQGVLVAVVGLGAVAARWRWPTALLAELAAVAFLAVGEPMTADVLAVMAAGAAGFFYRPAWLPGSALAAGVFAGAAVSTPYDVTETALITAGCLVTGALSRRWFDTLESDVEAQIAQARASVADCSEIVETVIGEVVRFTADTAAHMDEFASAHDDEAAAAFTARLDQVLLAGRLREPADF